MGEMRTRSGQVLTEELIEAIAQEAEAGFDPAQFRPRRIKQAIQGGGHSFLVQYRVDPATFEALLDRAREENRGVGEVARLALERYLCDAAQPAAVGSATPAPETHGTDVSSHVE